MYLAKPMESAPPRVNPNVNYGLWVIMMCQCRFISFNKCTTLVGDVHSRRGNTCAGSGNVQEISVPSPQFCCEPKTALKNSLNFTESLVH